MCYGKLESSVKRDKDAVRLQQLIEAAQKAVAAVAGKEREALDDDEIL